MAIIEAPTVQKKAFGEKFSDPSTHGEKNQE